MIKFFKVIIRPYIAGNVESWFEEHEDAVQHLPWPAQSSDFGIIEPLWLVSESRVRSRFPLPLSVKQLLVFLHEECYSIPLETIQNLYESIPRRIQAVSRQMVAQLRINKEKCIFHNCSIILSIPCMCCNYG
jgi:hypothetical protein